MTFQGLWSTVFLYTDDMMVNNASRHTFWVNLFVEWMDNWKVAINAFKSITVLFSKYRKVREET